MSPAKTAEPTEMPFGLRTRVGSANYVLDGGPDLPIGRGNFEGERASHCEVYGHSAVICAKMAEPIEMPFSLWAPMGPRNHVLDGVQIHSAVTCAKTAEQIDLWLDCGVGWAE